MAYNYEKRKCDFLKKLKDIGKFSLIGDFKNYKEEETIFKCNDCGFEFKSTREKILKRQFCPNCKSGTLKIAWLQHKMCVTHPKLSEYLLNKEDSYKFPTSTSKRLKWICPVCGIIFEKHPRRVEGEYICCNGCSDNYSQPNKYFYSFLRELNVEFETEKVFDWSKFDNGKNFKYDFYIESKNMIIEIMGPQHYPFDGLYYKTTYEQQHKIDIRKEQLANDNGVLNYIKINAKQSGFNFLKKSIIQDMKQYFNLDILNWENINCFATKSFIKEICEMYNSGQYTIKEISKKMKLFRSTVSNYLKQGSNVGICSYNVMGNSIQVNQFTKDGLLLMTYKSISEAFRQTGISQYAICKAFFGEYENAGGFVWKKA